MAAKAPNVAPGWVWMLRAAATYNVLVALPPLLSSATPDLDRIVSLLVGCFGILYFIISRAPGRLAAALWAGVIGKLGVLAIMVPAVAAGRQSEHIVPIIMGDALFTFGFLAFLFRGRFTT